MIIFGLVAIALGLLLAARPVGRGTPRASAALPEGGAPPEEPADEPEDEPAAEPAPPPRPLRLGESYSRAEIRALVGGSVQETLPHVGDRVVCGCFHPGYHPYAPFVVLPDFRLASRRWAEALADQEEPIPCFLKRGEGAWEYVGDFRVAALVEDPDEVAEWGRIAEREGDVSMVLHLEAAGDEADAESDAESDADAERA